MKNFLQIRIGMGNRARPLLPSVRGQASYTRPYTFITIAGTAGVTGGDDGTNGAARFSSPEGVAMDTNGNCFVVDNLKNTIRKVAPVGTNWVVTTIAGSPAGDSGSDDGMNSAARFYQPIGIALDGAGNLYLADSGRSEEHTSE